MTRQQRRLWLVVWLSGGVCAACASAPAPSQERLDTAFRAIQQGEARIEAAARELDGEPGACVERCDPLSQAIAEAREGGATVCESAATIEDDNDARVRCERARDRSAAIAARAGDLRERCGCGATPAASEPR